LSTSHTLPPLPEPDWYAVDTVGADDEVTFVERMEDALELSGDGTPDTSKITSLYTGSKVRDYAHTALASSAAEPRHVGESRFESWYEQHPKACGGDKQLARDAYAAGLGDTIRLIANQADEPFGYFRALPFGWTDCSPNEEGAIALYERGPSPMQIECLMAAAQMRRLSVSAPTMA
jgi:hypothetical protein